MQEKIWSPEPDFEPALWPGAPLSSTDAPGTLAAVLPTPVVYLTQLLFIGVLAFIAAAGLIMWHYAPAFADVDLAADASSQAQHQTHAVLANRIAPLFTPEVHYWETDITRWAQEFHLDANLIATVMQIESCGDPQAVSSAGASGLFQVMPFHFATGEDPFDPNTNAHRGLKYLQQALRRSEGDVRLALAGYNGGIGVIGLAEEFWPAETQRYTAWGAPIYADASAGTDASATLQAWLQHGGQSLCQRAHQHLGLP